MTKSVRIALMLIVLISLAGLHPELGAAAQSLTSSGQETSPPQADLELARRYAPVLYFHPDEIYHPQPVEVALGVSRLRQSRQMWFDTTILSSVTSNDLFSIPSDDTYFLDQWFGDTGSSEYANTSAHHEIYASRLSPHAGGPAPVTYAHIVRDENPPYITIQYWLFYFYQDWFNKHEGDWEFIDVILTDDEKPAWVFYSQHYSGARRSWESTPKEDATHPVAYVARDSHANYFAGDENYPHSRNIGNKQIILMDRTGASGRLVPDVILIPTREELAAHPGSWPGTEWLMYRGRWGETAVYGDFNGPYGPADKGEQWDSPYAWAMKQPPDGQAWYKNRLKVEISSSGQTQAHVQLADQSGQVFPQMESIDNQAILHINPPEKVLAYIDGTPGAHAEVTISWPDPISQIVTTMKYSGFDLDAAGHAQLEISPHQALSVPILGQFSLPSALVKTFKPPWNAPDTVFWGNLLPIQQILLGLLLALVYSLVPILIIIAILYWIDRYQKEPIRLLALAFIWGAIPALLIALGVQLLFPSHSELLGTDGLEAIRLGLLAPVLEETLKGAGVLFLYWRKRREINDVLDGMIYGALVGFGFAFLSNFARYAGSFVTNGYPAYNVSLIAERTVHALDHGLYTAIFGAGLGFAIKAKNRRQFWAWILAALALAIATHALHNLLANSTVGLNLFTVIVTALGTLVLWVVAGWSLVAQRRLLRRELQGQVHDSLYNSVTGPLSRAKAQWHAFRRHGFRAWLRLRRLQGLCIKLANMRLQARLFPEKTSFLIEADALQAQIKQAFER